MAASERSRPIRRTVLLAALSACCAGVLTGHVYLAFERTRVRIVTSERRPSAGELRVALPDLARLAGQPVAIVLRIEALGTTPTPVTVSLGDREVGTATVRPGSVTRVDRSTRLEGGARAPAWIALRSDGDDWALTYLEVANAHGYSQDPFGLIVTPHDASARPAVRATTGVLVFAGLLWFSWMFLGWERPAVLRIAQVSLGVIALGVYLLALAAPLVSPFNVLLSRSAYLIGLACLYVPGCWSGLRAFHARHTRALARLMFLPAHSVVSLTTTAPYLIAVGVFLFSVSGFHDSRLGFTKLIMFGELLAEQALPALRAAPHYIEPASPGYDGQYYAQLALDPLLRDSATVTAVDDFPYRARRMLFSWTAFALGLGRVDWILQAYALQNVLCWLLLAWLLLRWLPPGDAKSYCLWLGCLFSQGLLASVRLSLLEGPSLLLLALTVLAWEKGRSRLALLLAGLSGLGRETNVLSGAVGAVWRRRLPGMPEMARLAGSLVFVLAPLALWVAYLSAPDPLAYRSGGFQNFAPPLVAYIDTWDLTLDRLQADGWQSFSRFKLLALVSLTTQVAVLCARPQWRQAWWRVGVLYGLLMLVLGPAVWNGHPGAETRVLLPLTVAFNILLPRGRAFWPLLVLGNLTVIAGIEILQVPVVWRHV